jgi:hypothetical protein
MTPVESCRSMSRRHVTLKPAARTVVATAVLVLVTMAGPPSLGAGAAGETDAEGNGYAAGVLSTALLPSGAQVTSTVVSSLKAVTSALTGFPSANQYEAHAFYTDGESPTRVASYITSHVPKRTWGGSPISPGEDQIRVLLPVSAPNFVYAEDTYTIVRHHKGSEFRVDAHVDWSPIRPAAEDAPSSGTVFVTATTCRAHGQCRPDTVRVHGSKAQHIRLAFDRLAMTTGPAQCQGQPFGVPMPGFRVAFRPTATSAPTMKAATGGLCDKVSVTTPHAAAFPLIDDCAFQRSVTAVLPPGEGSLGGMYLSGCRP